MALGLFIKIAAQEAANIPHTPAWQPPIRHTLPHTPQLLLSVLVFTSHPSVSLFMLQSANPALQAPLHTDAAQVGLAMLLPEQTLPHPPQFALSALVGVSHPFIAMPSQLPNPALHAPRLHMPPAHPGWALGNPTHFIPHVLQLLGSVASVDSQPFCTCMSQSPKPLM